MSRQVTLSGLCLRIPRKRTGKFGRVWNIAVFSVPDCPKRQKHGIVLRCRRYWLKESARLIGVSLTLLVLLRLVPSGLTGELSLLHPKALFE